MGLSIFDERTPTIGKQRIVAADTTTLKSLLSSSTIPYRCDNILVTSTDTIDHKVRLWVTSGGVNYLLGSVDVPAGQGTLGTPPIDMIAALVAAGQGGLVGDSTTNYQVSAEVTVTGSTEIDVISLGGFY